MRKSGSISWLRIGAESLAIVASVLLALGVDAWWSDRQLLMSLRQSLSAVRVESESNIRLIEQELTYRRAVTDVIAQLREIADSDEKPDSEYVDELLGALTFIGVSYFSTGALDGTLQSGLLPNIKNTELRGILATLPRLYSDVERFERSDAELTQGQFYSYVNENGSFNQIANATESGRPGTGEFPLNYRYPVTEIADHSGLLQSGEFLGLLTQIDWSHLDTIAAHDRLRLQIERAIELIDQEIM